MTDRAITYPSIFDSPGRSLLALRGFPRNTVPSTIVLDRSHRVAAVFLTAVRVGELLPVVQRVAAEPDEPTQPAGAATRDGTPGGVGRERVDRVGDLGSAVGGVRVALAAGVVPFSSPCCLPLVPGHVG